MAKKRISVVLSCFILLMSSTLMAQAQLESEMKFPTKGITILCPTLAGGSLDLVARTIGPVLEKDLKVNVNIINRGGGAAIGVAEFGDSNQSDGHTMLIIDKGLISNYEAGVFKYGWRDFEPVGSLNKGMMFLVVNCNSNYTDLDSFIRATQETPDTITIGTPGSAGIGFLNAVGFINASGAKAKIVPFGSGAETKAALAGEHVHAAFLDGGEVMPLIKANMIKALGCSDVKRSILLPDVPTFTESGIDFSLTQAKSLWVNKNTPREVVDILANAVKNAVNSEAFQKLCTDTSQEPIVMTSEEMKVDFEQEEKIIRELMIKAGIKKN